MTQGLRRGLRARHGGLIAMLALAGCSAASSVAVGPAQTSIDCAGNTDTEIGITVHSAGSGIHLAARGTAVTVNGVNMAYLPFSRSGYDAADGAASQSVQGKVADVCRAAAFDLTLQTTAGPTPVPLTQHVSLPALGYQVSAPTLRLGPELALEGSGDIVNCSAQPLTFTITTTPIGSVQPGAVVQTTHLTLATGERGAYQISGARAVDQVAQAAYAISISAPGVPACTTGTTDVAGAVSTLPATNSP